MKFDLIQALKMISETIKANPIAFIASAFFVLYISTLYWYFLQVDDVIKDCENLRIETLKDCENRYKIERNDRNELINELLLKLHKKNKIDTLNYDS